MHYVMLMTLKLTKYKIESLYWSLFVVIIRFMEIAIQFIGK